MRKLDSQMKTQRGVPPQVDDKKPFIFKWEAGRNSPMGRDGASIRFDNSKTRRATEGKSWVYDPRKQKGKMFASARESHVD